MSETLSKVPSWVFGYGSLIWRPGFEFLAAQQARMHGVHRALCIYSHHYRGTAQRPGLVFGLMRGGSCHGMAFKVDPARWSKTYEYLCAREQVTTVYHEAVRSIQLSNGEIVRALTFVVNERHEQFAGRLDEEEQLRLIRSAVGDAGKNFDYVLNTIQHLDEMGINDRHLSGLGEKLLEKSD